MQKAAGAKSVVLGGEKLDTNFRGLIGKYGEITVKEYLEITDRESDYSDQSGQFVDVLGSYILVHLYDEEEFMCDVIDDCFDSLAKRYDNQSPEKILFCKIRARDLGSEANFIQNAVPTIQCYKFGKHDTGNFGSLVKPEIIEVLGEDFTTEDLMR